MKECELLNENRKAWLEKQNNWIKEKFNTPESSIFGSTAFSNDISLHSLSLRSDGLSRNRTSVMSDKSTNRKSKIPINLLQDFENQDISEEDRKILQLMTQRRQACIDEEDFAFSARNIWAADMKSFEKAAEERKKSWNQYITEKRKLENLDRQRRQIERQRLLKSEKMELESKINEKHEKVERRQKEIYYHKRLAQSSSGSCETLHKQMKDQHDELEELRKSLHINLCHARERRCEELYQCMLLEKYRRISDFSMKRDLRWQAAKDLREELNRRTEEIQKANNKRYNANQALSEFRVNRALDWKRKILLEKNKTRKLHHYYNYNRLKEDDIDREMLARQEIQKKDAKLKFLRDMKELAISKSRMNARTSASLRQSIRSAYGQ